MTETPHISSRSAHRNPIHLCLSYMSSTHKNKQKKKTLLNNYLLVSSKMRILLLSKKTVINFMV